MLGANIGIGNGPTAPPPSLVYSSPTDLGAKLFNFWDATDLSSLTLANGKVSSWTDKKAGIALTQATGASQPDYSATGFSNGGPCVTFDGTDDRLFSTGAAGTYPIGSTPGEIWVVLINDAPNGVGSTRHAVAYGLNGGAGNFRALGRGVFGGALSQRAITIAGPGGTSFTATANHGASAIWVSTYDVLRGAHTAGGPHCDDNAVVGPLTVGTLGAGSTRATLNIGSGAGAANFWQGRIQKVLFTDVLTDDEARALFNVLWNPPGSATLRTVPDTADSFYTVVKNPDGTADAIHFQRNVGSGGAGDLGVKWPEWRVTGRARLASFLSSPTAPTVTFASDPGAQDIVATPNGSVFMGSFHGLGAGGALNSETLLLDGVAFDPLVASTGKVLSIQNSTTATNGVDSFTRDLTTTIGESGGVHYKINSISKGGTISFVYLGMVIGSGAYDEADVQLTASGAWKTLPALGTSKAVTGQLFSTAAIKGLRLRDTSTGRSVQVAGSGIAALTNYVRAELARTLATDRLKGYFGRFSDVSSLAGAEWETNAAIVATGSLEGTNLMVNGNFATGDLTGWTKASGAGTATVVGGVMDQVREAAANHRMRQTLVITAAVNDVLAFRMDTDACSGGALPIARVANANTLSSVGAMVNQTTVLGRNLYVFVADVTTIWPGDEFSAGTAGQTADTDNYSLIKLN